MNRRFEVPADAAGCRLDVWLSGLPEAPTRSQIKQAASASAVLVDGRPAKVSLRLRGGECVELPEPPDTTPAEGAAEPEPIDLAVLYEDDAVLAIDKAAGMVVHPAVGHRRGTLVNAVLNRYPAAGLPGGADRAGIVHRLDKDTSGVILIARTVEAHEALSLQFRERTVEKVYLALVHGDVRTAGCVEAPIGRHRRDRKKMSVSTAKPRSAATEYRPLERFGRATLVEARPRTGRTHQIRVHLASQGWPIVGDAVYGGAGSARAGSNAERAVAEVLSRIGRQALHARRIAFAHPVTGTRIEVEAPLPADLDAVLKALAQLSGGSAPAPEAG